MQRPWVHQQVRWAEAGWQLTAGCWGPACQVLKGGCCRGCHVGWAPRRAMAQFLIFLYPGKRP